MGMKYKKIIIGVAVLIVLALSFFLKRHFDKESTVEINKEHKVGRSSITVTVLTTGTVQPESRVEIKPSVYGRIDSVISQEGDYVKQGQVVAWMSSSDRAALIDAARAEGPAEVARWDKIYPPMPIVAPISGTIILKNIENGQTVSYNDVVYVMSNRLTIKGPVDESDLAQIKIGQKVEARLDAYPNEVIDAKVERIAFEAKTISNVTTYTVSIRPMRTPNFMRSGMTSNVSFFVDTKNDVLTIPTEFIRYRNGLPYTKVKESAMKLVDRDITLGVSDGIKTEIKSGLKEGETIALQFSYNKEKKANNPFGPSSTKPKSGSAGFGPR